jgi:UDPglucose 6-dehydrogenase
MARLFVCHAQHEVITYDKFQPPHDCLSRKEAINTCDLVFLCVPTPTSVDGMSCDLTAVEECVNWINAPLCIRSTIPPGTVDRLSAATGKLIAFSPEYLGEAPSHPWPEEDRCGFLIVGGPATLCALVSSAYQSCLGAEIKCHCTSARTAELCKYMENCFLATKVAFVNQFYDIAAAFAVDFGELRKLWLVDPRIGTSHATVTEERGFRGRCLPKDVAALAAAMRSLGGAPLLEAVLSYNARVCEAADRARLASFSSNPESSPQVLAQNPANTSGSASRNWGR